METEVLVPVVVAAVVLLVLIALAMRASNRKKALRDRFGPEYDRTVDQQGSTRKAVRDLKERADEHDRLHLRELTSDERDRYRDQWQGLQASFVDRPESALADADRLLTALMRDRGYPVDDFDRQADMISVDHPKVVSHYRAAHAVQERSRHDEVSTEDQRKAVLHYRALFDELMVPGEDASTVDLRSSEARHPGEDSELDRVRSRDLAGEPEGRRL